MTDPTADSPAQPTRIGTVVPILAYHSVATRPAPWIAPFAVLPAVFAEHLDAIVEARATALTVSEFVDLLRHDAARMPERPVVITFDDGFADLLDTAVPELLRRRLAGTAYLVTGFLAAGRGPQGDRMLGWSALAEVASCGVEIGGHSHSHPQLDTLAPGDAAEEVRRCRALLEQHLGAPIRSFAYPHGYSDARVRALVGRAGFDSACAVGNAFSHLGDDPYRLARLLVRSHTTGAEVAAWLRGERARLAPRREPARTRLWRAYRRAGVRSGLRSSIEF